MIETFAGSVGNTMLRGYSISQSFCCSHICSSLFFPPLSSSPKTQRSNLVFGTTAFATIDEALAVAKKGDTLHVSDGRYTIDILTYYDLVSTVTINGVSACSGGEKTWWQRR